MTTPSDHPLAGLRVLDFSRVLAGPFATRILSDLGADVVKVEPPEGDVSRKMGRLVNDLSGMFTQQNVGKRSVCLDLTRPGAVPLVLALAARADAVIENFRPGVMDQFGVGWEALSAVNPGLVMLSISGFGQTGPEQDRASYAAVIHGEVGLLERQHTVDGTDRPSDLTFSAADTYSGLHGLVGLLAALSQAQRTGVGQHVDVAMVNAMFFSDDFAHHALDGNRVVRAGGQVFDAPGGPIVLAGDEKWYWRVLNTRAGVADPTPEGADLATKVRLRRRAIEDWLVSFPDRASLKAALDGVNLAWGDVNDHHTVFARQGSVEARQVVTTVDDRAGGQRSVVNTPYRFSAARAEVRGPAPYQGEHNLAAITDWLGDDTPDLELLHRQGVLIGPEPAEGPISKGT